MKPRSIVFVAFLMLTASLPGAGRAPGVKLEVKLTTQTLVSGTYSRVEIAATNPTSAPFKIPNWGTLEVSKDNGPYVATTLDMDTNAKEGTWIRVDSSLDLLVPPGQTRTLVIPLREGYAAPKFFTRGTSLPGFYRVRLTMIDADGFRHPCSFSFTVIKPEGEDARVWGMMQQITDGQGWGPGDWSVVRREFLDDLYRDHPTSSYVLFAGLTRVSALDIEGQQRQLALALSLAPDEDTATRLKFKMATALLSWAHSGGQGISEEKRRECAARAAEMLESLRVDPPADLRQRVEDSLDDARKRSLGN